MVREAGNNGFEAYRQLCLMYGTSDQEGLNQFLELVRRCEANITDPIPDQVKKACIISNTPEPLKTHFRKRNFNAFRVAIEDYLKSEDSLEVDTASRKGKAKRNPASARKNGGKKGQEIHSDKGHGETMTATLTIRRRMSRLWKVWTQSI